MKLSWERFDLQLKHTFRIARSAREFVPVLVLKLECDGIIAFGEASPNARYGESIETVEQFFNKLDFSGFSSPFETEKILEYTNSVAPGNNAAKCAIDLALHDWIGKNLDVPLWKLWGLDAQKAPLSSFTIAIDTPEIIRAKIREAEEYPILKIKLGGENDKEIIEAVRAETDKPLYVDANEGWKTRNRAIESVKWLTEQNVIFIEQPMPASQTDDLKFLRQHSNLPLIADESVHFAADIPALAQAFDGINIKLTKSAGLREALRMIATAKSLNMKTMVGCMIETSIGISAAAQLTPLLDYCDLDGNVLIKNDPFAGSKNIAGKIALSEKAGLGVGPRL
ncbi:MAG: dipeptide epimerase [Pyrinomonadaceae bacterium]